MLKKRRQNEEKENGGHQEGRSRATLIANELSTQNIKLYKLLKRKFTFEPRERID